MIEKIIPDHIVGLDGLPTTIMPDSAKLMRKINELVDAVNALVYEHDKDSDWYDGQTRSENVQKADIGELIFLQKENSKLKDELERITDILYESKYALEEMLNPSCISHEQQIAQEALDKVNAEIKALTKGGDNE